MRVNARAAFAAPQPIHEPGAKQTFSPSFELDRLVSACLLGEDQFYVDGVSIEARIRELAAKVEPSVLADIAVRARKELGLRHTPLLLLVVMAERGFTVSLRTAARDILRTPKDAMDLLALWWKGGKRKVPHAFMRAFRDGFERWTDYQVAKYATLSNVGVRLRDIARLSHPNPGERQDLFRALVKDDLRAPDTWEAALSRPGADKRAEWERLLSEGKLGALALVRNLRNMEQVGVEPALVREALSKTRASDVWPWQALAAAREAPAYTHDLDALMIRSAGAMPRIPGKTGILVDVSGSMDDRLSAKGTMKRMDAAAGLAVVLREACETAVIGSFSNLLVRLDDPLPRGATLANAIVGSQPHSGTQLVFAVESMVATTPDLDRLIVVTDEQANGYGSFAGTLSMPKSYVINLASYQRGVAWNGPVTRINGWSGAVVRWIALEEAGKSVEISDDQFEEVD